MGRTLVIGRKAQAFIVALPDAQRAKIKQAVSRLVAGDVQGLDIKKLKPHPHDYRLRIGGVRILFTSDAEKLFIYKAGYRGDVYK
ncbi:hypothetical protein G3N56_02910 [Desulfovibrio sulfodismutans]|uniref:Type II toxin-antitoxin system RelE/ParE family toxin n=1 Tax=Desulfolutivibrio sulfodismutans TaxID=63561 RepID=A0A7K3NHM8_9BACT|nr:hypothetical protein [Desulfolutivibrio sulfodismutans]NDY55692.1 hypothetical protein [Desulfolutivibrio sulfodismutans]QLA13714.1 hypothetical protein GD606_16340 [Desulfolutivibrio sulfodismutans DSM 3696]